jgi:TetR/AcrR family transcriptional regulator, ethionamide resistance regulator
MPRKAPSVRGSDTRPRRRRKAEDAELEILDAAENFLRTRPFHAMTVDDLMARTGLSRPSFYEYFRDRYALARKLVERMLALMFPMSDRWFSGTGAPEADLRSGFEGLVAVYREHGPLMRALRDAAAQDRRVQSAYEIFIERMIEGTAARIGREIAEDRTAPLNPEETARALVLMGERYLADKLEREPAVASSTLVDTLLTVWMRVLYGTKRAAP